MPLLWISVHTARLYIEEQDSIRAASPSNYGIQVIPVSVAQWLDIFSHVRFRLVLSALCLFFSFFKLDPTPPHSRNISRSLTYCRSQKVLLAPMRHREMPIKRAVITRVTRKAIFNHLHSMNQEKRIVQRSVVAKHRHGARTNSNIVLKADSSR